MKKLVSEGTKKVSRSRYQVAKLATLLVIADTAKHVYDVTVA